MTVSQSGTFSIQEFSDAGLPLALGRLYTYTTGTTTQKTAYTDAAGLVPHTYTSDGAGGQYIALNGRGELPAPLYLLTDSGYDLALKRADGSTVWTRRADGVAGSSTTAAAIAAISASYAASSGSAIVGFLQAGSGAVARTSQDKMRDVLNALDFGVKGDGTTNDTAAINNALAAAFTAGKKLYFPAGTYRYNEATPGCGYALLNRGTSMIGDGRQSVFFAPQSTMPATADFMWVNPNTDISQLELSGFFVWPDFDGTVRGRRGIYFLFDAVVNLSKLHVHNMVIRPCNNYGIEINNVVATNPQGVPAYSLFDNNLLYDGIKAFGIGDSNVFRDNFQNTPSGSGRHGLWIYHVDGGGGVSSHSVIYGNAMVCDGAALLVDRGRNIKFMWNNVEQSHGPGSTAAAVIDINGSGGIVPGVEIKGNHLGVFGTTLVNKVIRLNGAAAPEVEANTFLSGFLLTDCINITGSCSDAYIGRNAMNTAVFSNPVNNSGIATAGVTILMTLSGGASAAGAGYASPSYYKSKENVVFLKGTASGVAIASGTTIATLPSGYRPAAIERFTINATIAGTPTTAVIEVDSAGVVKYIGTGAATLICLSGLMFTTTPIVLGTT